MEKNIFEGSANDMINQIAIIKHDIFDSSNDKTIDAFDLALKFFFANKKIRKIGSYFFGSFLNITYFYDFLSILNNQYVLYCEYIFLNCSPMS